MCSAVAVYVLGVLHGMDWERRVRDYLTGLYHYIDREPGNSSPRNTTWQSDRRPGPPRRCDACSARETEFA